MARRRCQLCVSESSSVAIALGAHLVLLGIVLCARYPASLNPAALSNGPTPLRVAEDLSCSLGLRRRGLHFGALCWFTFRLRLIGLSHSPPHPDLFARPTVVELLTSAARAL